MSGLAPSDGVRVLIVEDEPLMAAAIRDGLRVDAIAADIARRCASDSANLGSSPPCPASDTASTANQDNEPERHERE